MVIVRNSGPAPAPLALRPPPPHPLLRLHRFLRRRDTTATPSPGTTVELMTSRQARRAVKWALARRYNSVLRARRGYSIYFLEDRTRRAGAALCAGATASDLQGQGDRRPARRRAHRQPDRGAEADQVAAVEVRVGGVRVRAHRGGGRLGRSTIDSFHDWNPRS